MKTLVIGFRAQLVMQDNFILRPQYKYNTQCHIHGRRVLVTMGVRLRIRKPDGREQWIFFFFFLVLADFELKASCFLGRHPTTRAKSL
jgi:hypothetical protein